jgi:histidine kinase
VAAAIAATALVGYATYRLKLRDLRRAADESLSLKSHNVVTEVERYRYLPFVVAQDPRIGLLLDSRGDPDAVDRANRYLETVNAAAGSAVLYVLDGAGEALAASNWRDGSKSFVGKSYAFRTYFKDALARGAGSEYAIGSTTGIPGYFLSRRFATSAGRPYVAVVKVDMSPLEQAWGAAGERVALADRAGMIFLSSVADWRFRPLFPISPEDRRRIESDRQYLPGSLSATPLLPAAEPNDSRDLNLSFRGGTLLIRVADVPSEGWRLMAGYDIAPAQDWAYLMAAVIFLTAGLLLAAVSYRRERGQRKQLEDLRAILENMSVGIAVFDPALRLLAWNTKYLKLNTYPEWLIQPGRSLAEIIDHNIRRGDYGSGDPEQQLQQRLDRASQEAVPFEAPRPDGTWVEIMRSRTPDGRFIHIHADITARKHAEAELDAHRNHLERLVEERTGELMQLNRRLQEAMAQADAAKHQAERANRAKTKFLNAVSHDIRNPLNAILGYAGLVMANSKEALPGKQYENLQKLAAKGRELNELVGDFLDYSRAERVTTSTFRLGAVIEQCRMAVEFMVDPDQVRLQCDLPDDLPSLVQDERKLRRTIVNLMSNAAKFTEKGEIRLSARRRGDSIEISVADSGIGIGEEYLGSIFEEFERVELPGQRPREGTGLGLAICRRFATLMGGEISVRSRIGEGSVFTLSLPIVHPGADAAVETCVGGTSRKVSRIAILKRPGAEEADRAAAVLVVDDSRANRDYLVQLLEPHYSVLVAADGKKAVEMAELECPDLILMDLSLPVLDGWEAIRRIRALATLRPIPIIVVTAHVTEADRKRASAAGCEEFLSKPVDETMLFALLRRHLGSLQAVHH